MSQRSPVRSSGHPGHDGLRAQPKLPAKPLPADRSGWTLGHAGRQVRIGPVAFWIIVGSLVVMAGWSATTATYFAFRDDVLTGLLARQAQMQFAYEDRIADLRGQVDRLASRQLLDQEQFESKLDQITRRQAVLESRSSALSGLPDPTATGSIKSAPRAAIPAAPQAMPKPSPISDTIILVPPPEREARRVAHAVQFRRPARHVNPGRHRGRARAPAGFARPLRGRPGQEPQRARGELRHQGTADAQCAGRSRTRCRQDRAAASGARERRPVRAGQRAERFGLRPATVPHPAGARTHRSPEQDARRRADPQADFG